jgi:acyl-CoA thioesterase I
MTEPTRFVQALANGETRRLVGLGDSLTYGYMVGRGYFDQLLGRLATRYPAGRVEPVNQGVCGATAEDGARRLSYGMRGGTTDMLLVQFGLNDAYMGIHAKAFQDMVARIIERARAEVPELEIILVPPPPLDDAREQRLAAPFTAAMEALTSPPEVRIADVAASWRAEAGEALFLVDGVHPTEAGYACMAEAVFKAMAASPT